MHNCNPTHYGHSNRKTPLYFIGNQLRLRQDLRWVKIPNTKSLPDLLSLEIRCYMEATCCRELPSQYYWNASHKHPPLIYSHHVNHRSDELISVWIVNTLHPYHLNCANAESHCKKFEWVRASKCCEDSVSILLNLCIYLNCTTKKPKHAWHESCIECFPSPNLPHVSEITDNVSTRALSRNYSVKDAICRKCMKRINKKQIRRCKWHIYAMNVIPFHICLIFNKRVEVVFNSLE